jgi:lactoylglutathione lyase
VKLAKPCIDVGLTTNRLEPMLRFWQQTVGVPFDHALPIRRGLVQHRHALSGSVLKINHATDPLPDTPPSGYRALVIARPGVAAPRELVDPDGNRVRLVPAGTQGVTQIGVELGVRNPAAHARFYREALGCSELPGSNGSGFRAGDSVIRIERSDDAPSDASFEGRGWRYVTFQVFRVDDEHAAVLAHGGREAMAPRTLGKTARISMVRDPDGNWIELSQRASLVGSLE